MNKNSVVSNYFFNLVNTVTGLLFPLITFPYAARILMPQGIGLIQFYSSIIEYITLITALGIPLYAVREVARHRDNIEERNRISMEILIFHIALSFIAYLLVYVLLVFSDKIQQDIPLFLLLSLSIFFNTIAVNWFFQAVEEFQFIAIRSFCIRLLSLVALFLFVHTKDDLLQYAAITVCSGVGASIFNLIRFRALLGGTLNCYKKLRPLRHFKPSLNVFILNLIISIYVNLDSVMLGFLKNDQSVGYYTAAIRLTKVQLGIVSALGTILLPRFSSLIAEGQIEKFISLANNAISYIFALSVPLTTATIILAPKIINLLCGQEYSSSIIVMQIISPIIIFIGLSGMIGIQILYPLGEESKVIRATLIGAILNFSINVFLIPTYAEHGAAIATFIAEFSVMVVLGILVKRRIPIKFLSKQNFSYFMSSFLLLTVICLIDLLHLTSLLSLIVSFILGSIVYLMSLYWFNDYFILQGLEIFKRKFKR